jgi:membrane protein YqaA with SNARE-associated domain
VIAACLTAALTALVSAFFPITPVEPYLLALAAATEYSPIALGVAAAVGQTIGKTTLFLGARGAFRSARLRRWVEAAEERRDRRRASAAREDVATGSGTASTATDVRVRRGPFAALIATGRRLLALLDRPSLAVPILLLSATTGLPPLMATSIYAAGTRINLPLFVAACLVGRSIRFIAIAYAPQLVLAAGH